MNTGTDCERIRLGLMAALDGEGSADHLHQQHLSGCTACQAWLRDTRAMSERLERLEYQDEWNTLWPGVASRIREQTAEPAVPRDVWVIAGVLAAWRVLVLSLDVPIPIHAVFSIAATLGVVRLAARNLLTIETWAPELQK